MHTYEFSARELHAAGVRREKPHVPPSDPAPGVLEHDKAKRLARARGLTIADAIRATRKKS